MLVLRRTKDQGVIIGERIVVKVLAIEADRIVLGIEAPKGVHVVRSEICDKPAGGADLGDDLKNP